MKKYIILTAFALTLAPAAWADNVAHCEVLLMQTVEDEAKAGTFQIASYRPAAQFIASLHDEDPAHQTEVDGHKIQALLCRRNDIIPAETDYPMMATGVPFVLSQDFDSAETDSLTLFWKAGAFDYVYKGHPLSEEAEGILKTRLAYFSQLGLSEAVKIAQTEAEAEADAEAEPETETEIEIETETDIDVELEAAAADLPEDAAPEAPEAVMLETDTPKTEKPEE